MKEGKAEIEVFEGVFFNPKMRGLRDISVSYVKALSNGLSPGILDATSATGIRGIRYALEAGAEATFLEINKKAYSNTIHNMNLNGIDGEAFNKSIQEFSNTYQGAFDFIDLDPFGSPAPYIYDLLKISKGDTRLMITATDTAVLCGAHPNACLKEYFSMPIHNELCHESGLRILSCFVARTAAQFNFGIEVELAIANLHYMRLFVKLRRGADEAVKSIKQCGYLLHCSKCRNFKPFNIYDYESRTCKYCGNTMQIYGPMWLSTLSNKEVLKKVISSYSKDYSPEALKLLEEVYEEGEEPFFFSVPKITRYLHIGSVSRDKVAEELSAKGFRVSRSHTDRNSLKGNFEIGDVVETIKRIA
ncbi:MAG: tRNA (guanine(10)-N(2))-dimethyltransferase [Candidatus Micrarchaeia archaeon]|jgi:tRNA (guanine26-N2/guanine27-N2)-dimethyltransferase